AIGLAPEKRQQFLRQECSDETVIAQVDQLLRHHHLAGTAFLGGTGGDEPTPPPQPSTPQHGGRFTIVGAPGQGGVGAVYEAEQDPPRRRVALKLIRPGLMTPHMLRRFEYEADVLGRLEHPGIARIYHAGVTETPQGQQPYFAMELVRGMPLDQWVKR